MWFEAIHPSMKGKGANVASVKPYLYFDAFWRCHDIAVSPECVCKNSFSPRVIDVILLVLIVANYLVLSLFSW